MWQDDYISERDGEFVCWDHRGEFIAVTIDKETAITIISNYINEQFKGKCNAKIIQQPISVIK